jgi:hypothetical protein
VNLEPVLISEYTGIAASGVVGVFAVVAFPVRITDVPVSETESNGRSRSRVTLLFPTLAI